MIVRSGMWDPPREGSLVRKISPLFILMFGDFMRIFTQIDIAPRWTGICGAFTRRLPSAVRMAQEKSSLSFTFTEKAVF